MRRHTKDVRVIIEEVCVYDSCRWWWNVVNPFSSLEFVTVALLRGIPEQLEARYLKK
jgi:hypothetical protein